MSIKLIDNLRLFAFKINNLCSYDILSYKPKNQEYEN